jgi:hypothetical protein
LVLEHTWFNRSSRLVELRADGRFSFAFTGLSVIFQMVSVSRGDVNEFED